MFFNFYHTFFQFFYHISGRKGKDIFYSDKNSIVIQLLYGSYTIVIRLFVCFDIVIMILNCWLNQIG